jgi:hypothetical protein
MADSEQMNVTIEMVVDTVTITAEGMADTIYRRTVTDTATGDVVLRDAVRETTRIADVFGGVVKTVELFLLTGMKSDISANVTAEMFKNTAPPKIKW